LICEKSKKQLFAQTIHKFVSSELKIITCPKMTKDHRTNNQAVTSR
jgi:hypothetical protein